MDRAFVGTTLPPATMTIEPGRLRLFAKATGQTDPVYFDREAAAAAGHPHLLVPPTFLFAVELEQPDPLSWLTRVGADLRQVLHGEQSFVYHRAVHAGTTVIARPRITDIYTKKSGRLVFVVKQTSVTRASDDEVAAELETVAVVTNSSPQPA